MSSSARQRPHWGLILAVLFLTVGSIAAEVRTVGLFVDAWKVGGWPTATGTVTRSQVEKTPVGAKTRYDAHIEYDYTVEGRTYRSARVRVRGTSSKNGWDINGLAARYPTQARVTVYYDPDRPGDSYLEAGADFFTYVVVVVPALTALLFGYATIRLAYSWLRSKETAMAKFEQGHAVT